MRPTSLFLAGLVLAFPLAGQKNDRNPFTSAADIESGHKLYNVHCRTCHGANGERRDPTAKLASTFRRYGSSDREMFQTISNRIPGTGMPGFYVGEDTVWKILAFVRTLEAGAEHAGEMELAASSQRAPQTPPVSSQELLESANRPAEWLMYAGDYFSHRYSGLRGINRANVNGLRLKWLFQRRVNTSFETTPLVAGGVMYVTAPPNDVYALNADSGDLLWEYRRPLPIRIPACCGQVNRGLAIAGDCLFMATLDAHLVALNRTTGKLVWDVPMADYREGYTATHAPLVVKDKVLAGVAGGEYGIRGFLDAYRISDGGRVWRAYTIPGPGEFGSDTWSGDSWKRGGAPIWLTGSYDPELNLTYWGTGNPGPDWNGEVRSGDNLFACSVLALDADTGERRWYFQFTPHDTHDWDAVQTMVLVNHAYEGKPRRLLVTANRNGFYYVLDRASGAFLHAQPYVKQTWAREIDDKGRPVELPDTQPKREGVRVYPSTTGGTNWWSPSWSPVTDLFYVAAVERASMYFTDDAIYQPGTLFEGGTVRAETNPKEVYSSIRALDVVSGKLRWEYRMNGLSHAGMLSTAGGIVFGGSGDGRFFALDAYRGKELWSINLGGLISAAPIAFESQGRERIAIAAGGGVFVFGMR